MAVMKENTKAIVARAVAMEVTILLLPAEPPIRSAKVALATLIPNVGIESPTRRRSPLTRKLKKNCARLKRPLLNKALNVPWTLSVG